MVEIIYAIGLTSFLSLLPFLIVNKTNKKKTMSYQDQFGATKKKQQKATDPSICTTPFRFQFVVVNVCWIFRVQILTPC